MKYIIEFEDEYSMNEGGMKYHQCKQVPYWSVSHGIIKNLTPYNEPDRKAIEDEVWELAKTVSIMKPEDKRECWGTDKYNAINLGYSYQEAKARYEAWKKEKNEIRVGDEVAPDNANWKGVVVAVDYGFNDLIIMDSSGKSANYDAKGFSKTGRHFSQVEELMKKMKEK